MQILHNKGIPVSLLIILLIISADTFGQYGETISSNRPGQAITSTSVGKRVFQVESGIDYGGQEIDISTKFGKSYGISTLLRYGLTETFEVNLGIGLKSLRINMPDSVFNLNRYSLSKIGSRYRNLADSSFNLGDLNLSTLGIRYNITEGKGIKPTVGFQFTVKLNVFNGDYNADNIAPQFLMVTNQELFKRFFLTTNLGADWDGNNTNPTGIYAVNLALSINDKWGGFIENYGSFDDSYFDTGFDAGIAYLVNNNLQLDILGGIGNNLDLIDYFVSFGISWRKRVLKKGEQKATK